MELIAEEHIDLRHLDGTITQIHFRIHKPQPHPEGKGDWGCVVEARGLWDDPIEIFGEGSFQALMLAISYMRKMTTYEVERGNVLLWCDGTDGELSSLFATN